MQNRRCAALPGAAFVLLALLTLLPPTAAAIENVSTFRTGLNAVRSLALDASGRLYASLRAPVHQIVRFSLPDATPTVFASTGLSDPIDMVFDDDGNLYVADYTGGKVHKITPAGVLSTFATAVSPGALTRDPAGNLYVGEYFSQKVFKITPAGVKTLYATVGSSGTRITALYYDSDGSIYTGDLFGSGTIHRIAPGGSPVTTFSSGLGSVVGLTRGPTGELLTTTYEHNTVRRIAPDGTDFLFAGATGIAGMTDGPANTARFNYPAGMIYVAPLLYIADFNNDRIRTIDFGPTPAARTSWGRVKSLYRSVSVP